MKSFIEFAARSVEFATLIISLAALETTGGGFNLCATLHKLIGLENWAQIRTFAAISLLRTLLNQVFQREQEKVWQRTRMT